MHEALLDNINTAGAMEALAGLIRSINVYLAARQGGGSSGGAADSAAAAPNPLLLQQASGARRPRAPLRRPQAALRRVHRLLLLLALMSAPQLQLPSCPAAAG